MEYFTHFWNIVKTMQNISGIPPQELKHLVIMQRENLRFNHQDLVDATRILGFGSGGPLGAEFDDDIPEDLIISAWRGALETASKDSDRGSEYQKTVTEAFKVIAD